MHPIRSLYISTVITLIWHTIIHIHNCVLTAKNCSFFNITTFKNHTFWFKTVHVLTYHEFLHELSLKVPVVDVLVVGCSSQPSVQVDEEKKDGHEEVRFKIPQSVARS